jgi:hypothetical protein
MQGKTHAIETAKLLQFSRRCFSSGEVMSSSSIYFQGVGKHSNFSATVFRGTPGFCTTLSEVLLRCKLAKSSGCLLDVHISENYIVHL